MIHLFSLTCKPYKYKIKNCNELFIISELDSLKPDDERCPECKAPSFKFTKNGYYNRHFVHMANGYVNDSILKIHEIKCSSCGRSHALLNLLIIPYSPYSIGFIITLIYLRITRKFKTISSLCDFLGISERTYYRLMQRLLLHHPFAYRLWYSFHAVEHYHNGTIPAINTVKDCSIYN